MRGNKESEKWVKAGHAHVRLCKRGNIWTQRRRMIIKNENFILK